MQRSGATLGDKTSICNAYMRKHYGPKAFVFALLQTGMSWKLPDPEHAARRFVQWVRDLVEAIQFHHSKESTQLARRKSGTSWGNSGLTLDEIESRRVRDQAERLEET